MCMFVCIQHVLKRLFLYFDDLCEAHKISKFRNRLLLYISEITYLGQKKKKKMFRFWLQHFKKSHAGGRLFLKILVLSIMPPAFGIGYAMCEWILFMLHATNI